jgi:galactose-6-phosphate isomerase
MFILGSDRDGAHLKEIVKQDLLDHSFDVLDVTENTECDFVDAALAVIREVQRDEDRFGIIIDAYGAGPFMTACKIKGIIAAEVSDERSAYMTRSHNNAKIITLGAKITGPELAKNIVRGFAKETDCVFRLREELSGLDLELIPAPYRSDDRYIKGEDLK